MAKNEVTESRLYVIRKKDVGDSTRLELRIVSWNYRAPKLENRSFYKKDGRWLTGKLMGLDAGDMAKIAEKSVKINRLLALTEAAEIKEVEKARLEKLGKV